MSYKTNEKNYFRKLIQLAKAQWESHNEENVQKPPENELSYKRAVLDCETGMKANSEWELDQVELNNIKVEKKDILNYYGDVKEEIEFLLILIGVGTIWIYYYVCTSFSIGSCYCSYC